MKRIREVIDDAPEEDISSHLDDVIGQITARMGRNVIRRATAIPGFNVLETGIFTLDFALLGGIPEGPVVELYGYESSGKTTLAQRLEGAAQRKHPQKSVVHIDCEHAFDNQWAAKHGVDLDRLLLVHPDSGEQAVDIIDAVLRAPETAMVVLDSLPSLVPMKEAEGTADTDFYAIRSKLIGRMCSKILQATSETRNKFGASPTVIFINQWRQKIGGMGDPRILPGGNQHKYLATTMIEIKNKEVIEQNDRKIEIVSHNIHSFLIKKCRTGNSLRQGEFTMIRDPKHPLGEGAIDEMGTVATFAKKFGLITGGGSSWRIDGSDQKFPNLAGIVELFAEDSAIYLDIRRRILIAQRRDMGLRELPED